MLNISQPKKVRRSWISYFDIAIRLCMVACLILISVAALSGHNTVKADSAFNASDLLGQLDINNNPVWSQGAPHNNTGLPGVADSKGMYRPQGTVIDTVHHRLFVSTCGARVLVYNLDTNNNLIDRLADNELGQPDISTDYDPRAGPSSITQNNLRCPAGAAVDETGNRLFVADSYRDRIMVYDFSSGISNGMNASYVLGSPDFSTGQYSTTQSRMAGPYGGLAYDPTTHFLYVADSGNSRVLVFNLSGGISNGMNAAHVIGQGDFTSSNLRVTQNGMSDPYGMALDTSGHRLFVADDTYCDTGRVLVYDISNISDGMNASQVLGVPDFTSHDNSACNEVTAANMDPEGLAYDSRHQLLYVEDSGANRILVFDVSTIINGEDALGVIGQPDFTTSNGSCIASSSTMCYPEGLSDYYDTANNRLYFSDFDDNRVMIFNFARLVGSLPNGTVGSAYAIGSIGQQTQGSSSYSIASGSLPSGLSLNNSSGSLSGIPSASGTYNFTIKLTDNNGMTGIYTDIKSYSVTINSTGGASNSVSSHTALTSAELSSSSINLNDTESFNSSSGSTDAYQVDSLSAGQSLSFLASGSTTDKHTVTIDSISGDTVSLTLRSSPMTVTLSTGQSREIDVDNDGHDDIGIELVKISPPTASFKFWKISRQLSESSSQAQIGSNPSSPNPGLPRVSRIKNLIWGAGGILAIVCIAGAWVYIAKNKNLKPGPG